MPWNTVAGDHARSEPAHTGQPSSEGLLVVNVDGWSDVFAAHFMTSTVKLGSQPSAGSQEQRLLDLSGGSRGPQSTSFMAIAEQRPASWH